MNFPIEVVDSPKQAYQVISKNGHFNRNNCGHG